MDNTVLILVDGVPRLAHKGMTVAAALMAAGHLQTRHSVQGEPRFALCGMGVCQECRVTINGEAHRLACQTLCAHDMLVETQL